MTDTPPLREPLAASKTTTRCSRRCTTLPHPGASSKGGDQGSTTRQQWEGAVSWTRKTIHSGFASDSFLGYINKCPTAFYDRSSISREELGKDMAEIRVPCQSNDGTRPEIAAETRTRLVIDSRDRNTLLFPSPNRFDVTLAEDVRDVQCLELLSADVPLSAYLVSTTNNVIPFCDASTMTMMNAVLAIGDYTPDDLASEVQRAMNAASEVRTGNPDDFVVTYLSRTDNFLVKGRYDFRLKWRGEDVVHASGNGNANTSTFSRNCAAALLGFGKLDAASSMTGPVSDARAYTVTSPFRKNFEHPSYVVLRVEGAEANVSPGPTIDRSFATIIDRRKKDGDGGSYLSFPESRATYVYNPPVSRFNRMRISLHGYDGRPYDIQNHDIRLEFSLVSRERTRLCVN